MSTNAARKGSLGSSAAPLPTCAWRTGNRQCVLVPTGDVRCQWHRQWGRLIDLGIVGRSQYDEFAEWWEQFQPYGCYAENPGPWWADIHALWSCLVGLGELPVLTEELARELYLRRVEVRRYRQGIAWERDPWPRITGSPLPPWKPEEWQAKAAARLVTPGSDRL